MGHGYTGNHPRYTMIHDRELIYDAKKQLHRADKSLHAYDDKKHAMRYHSGDYKPGMLKMDEGKAAAYKKDALYAKDMAYGKDDDALMNYMNPGEYKAFQGGNKPTPVDMASASMLPGKIHPLSDVYGSVRNLETYMPVDNRAATKAMVDTDKLGAQGKMVEGIAKEKGLLKKGCKYKR